MYHQFTAHVPFTSWVCISLYQVSLLSCQRPNSVVAVDTRVVQADIASVQPFAAGQAAVIVKYNRQLAQTDYALIDVSSAGNQLLLRPENLLNWQIRMHMHLITGFSIVCK